MTAVTIRGLAALQRRLKAASMPEAFARSVRQEAESLVQAARQNAPEGLAASVEIRDERSGQRPAYAVGTPHPAGRFLEFGTARRLATPWLMPLFWARSQGIKDRLGKIIGRALRGV